MITLYPVANLKISDIIVNVSMERLTAQKKEALLSLIDDPSPLVRSELLKEFTRLGTIGQGILEELSSGSNRLLCGHARLLLEELRKSNPIEEFRAFIHSLNYELESGIILLCRVAYPNLAPEEIIGQIDDIANRCRELLIKPTSPRERCIVINRVLFHELGFRGNSEDYDNPNNGFLNKVFETKKGLPITLSILYILVGQRIGADLDPIAYPGHFMVGSFEDDFPFYIDAYSQGRFSDPQQLLGTTGGFLSLAQIGNLAPASIREVLARCCTNLAKHYGMHQQTAMSQLFASFVDDFENSYQQQAN